MAEHDRYRVVYCASQRAGAFGEAVARFRPSLATLHAMTDGFEVDNAEVPRARGQIPADWRTRRRMGVTELDDSLRFVDVAAAETLTWLRTELAALALALDLDDVDLSLLTSVQRRFTQETSRYIHDMQDEPGRPTFAGIRYVSRLHAEWECWAVFHDRMLHSPHPHETIFPDDPALIAAATHLGLTMPDS